MPKISIGITTFKRPEKLINCIRSIFNQTYKDYEIIIGNDDPNQKITSKINDLFSNSKIRIINNDKNLGERDNMNNLLKIASGEYFIWLSDDDILFPNFFEKNIINLEQNDKVVASYTSYTSKKELSKKENNFQIFEQKEFLENYLSKKIKLIGVYGLFRKKFLIYAGGMQKTSKSLENDNNEAMGMYPYADIILPIKISKFGKIAYSYEELIFYELSGGSRSSITKDLNAHIKSENNVRAAIYDAFEENSKLKEQKENFEYYLAKWFFINQMSIINRIESKKNIQKFILILQVFIRYILNLNIKNKLKFIKSILLK